ncbi:MAG: pyruvate kinase alpha/beta domain-containing protein [Dehalococcoidia bacterium]|nr:pyruvate kinase alpha/beta domain-containing protein [Dehalococcoidia bacterium]
MESRIVYFEKQGKTNTEEVLRISRQRAKELGIKTVVVSTTTGYSAIKALEVFEGSGIKVVIVSEATGMYTPDVQEMTPENQEIIKRKGGIVLTTTHALAGIDRAWRNKFNTWLLADVISSTLRLFGEGIKVCPEIAIMAADAGLVRCDEDVICIAGSHRGADTAVVLRPVNTHRFFDMRIKEILCKPLNPFPTVQPGQVAQK